MNFIICTDPNGKSKDKGGNACGATFDIRLVYNDLCPNCYSSITIAKWECQENGCGKINKGGRTFCSNNFCKARAEKKYIRYINESGKMSNEAKIKDLEDKIAKL
jgi:hypothetical protein